jgi:hypothetical protein
MESSRDLRTSSPVVILTHAAAPTCTAAIATVASATSTLLASRADPVVGPFLGPNPAILGRMRATTEKPLPTDATIALGGLDDRSEAMTYRLSGRSARRPMALCGTVAQSR